MLLVRIDETVKKVHDDLVKFTVLKNNNLAYLPKVAGLVRSREDLLLSLMPLAWSSLWHL